MAPPPQVPPPPPLVFRCAPVIPHTRPLYHFNCCSSQHANRRHVSPLLSCFFMSFHLCFFMPMCPRAIRLSLKTLLLLPLSPSAPKDCYNFVCCCRNAIRSSTLGHSSFHFSFKRHSCVIFLFENVSMCVSVCVCVYSIDCFGNITGEIYTAMPFLIYSTAVGKVLK